MAEQASAGSAGYSLTVPEGYPISAADLAAFTQHCLETGLSKEQAEKSLLMLSNNYKAMQADFAAVRQAWVNEIRNDREFGGKHFQSTVADARRALATFDQDGAVSELLERSGYGDNPAIIRLFTRIGKAMNEDSFVSGKGGSEQLPLEERFYRNM